MIIRNLCAGIIILYALTACNGGGNDNDTQNTENSIETETGNNTTETETGNDTTSSTDSSTTIDGSFRVLAFNDLGMHCMDREYSIFSILPPYNVLNAQVVRTDSEPTLFDDTQIEVRYEATADPEGSINSSSVAKTDFWQYANTLFDLNLNTGEGLKGFYMPADNPVSPGPQTMQYNTTADWFSAEGIPITPLDDTNWSNPYPILQVSAYDKNTGERLTSTDVVVPVAQETDCKNCHATGQSATWRTEVNWATDADLEIQAKKNVLKLHDFKHSTSLESGIPVLCASCHYTAALDLSDSGPQGQQSGKPTLSAAMHGHHGSLLDSAGNPLFPADAPVTQTCYQCHPGATTQCQRGAMKEGGMECHDCHGSISAVGNSTRQPWQDLPACQSCHTGDAVTHLSGSDLVLADDGIRLRQAYRIGDSAATPIQAPDSRFAENADTLYRNSKGHGGIACEGCHGSTHAIWPAKTNDNVTAQQLQGHTGPLSACNTCHTSLSLTLDGPHGMHNVSDTRWSDEEGHGNFYERNQDACRACHGTDLLGSPLAKMSTTRTIGRVTLQAGQQVACNLCHGLPR